MSPFDVAWVAATIRLAAPLLLAGAGELVSQRAGVLNVGLEGMILTGALSGFLAGYWTGNAVVGVLGGLAGGLLIAGLMALFSIWLHADQIVVGIGLNLLALGATDTVYDALFAGTQPDRIGRLGPVPVPMLGELPWLERVLTQSPLVYLAYLGVVLAAFLLYRTTIGLELRAIGDGPAAAEAAGVRVRARQTFAVLLAGAGGGLAGAFLSVAQLGLFVEGMSGGRGFLVLAVVIFGRWRPSGVLAGALVFAGADALQLRLQAEPSIPGSVWLVAGLAGLALLLQRVHVWRRGGEVGPGSVALPALVTLGGLALALYEPAWTFPGTLWLALPFVLALLTLALLRYESRAPATLGLAYGPER